MLLVQGYHANLTLNMVDTCVTSFRHGVSGYVWIGTWGQWGVGGGPPEG